MSFRGKRELLVQVAPRYSSARHGQRSVILDEFVAVTGYERKYAIRLLLGPIRPPAPIRRPRAAQYGPDVQEALSVVWSAANGICAKRLVPFLPELVPTLPYVHRVDGCQTRISRGRPGRPLRREDRRVLPVHVHPDRYRHDVDGVPSVASPHPARRGARARTSARVVPLPHTRDRHG